MVDLFFLSFSVFLCYLSYSCITLTGVPISLSDTYYELGKIDKPKWLFQVCMVLSGGLLMPYMIEISPDNFQFLAFIGCGGLLFVGVAPAFKLPLEGTVHFVSAYICGGCSVLWVILMGLWFIPVILFVISLILILVKYSKEKIFFLEMVAFFSVYFGILYLLLK